MNDDVFALEPAAFTARRCINVAMVLQNRERLDYRKLLERLNRMLHRCGERYTVTTADFDDLKAVTRKLHKAVTASNTTETVRILNEILAAHAHPPCLDSYGEAGWQFRLDGGDDMPWAERFAVSSAMALATLVVEKQRNPCGRCASLACRRLFVDLGKGGRRRYCSPRCASRERVAAHRVRTKAP